MKRTNIYLAEGQAAALDRIAQAEGVSRAELIRELIDRAIGGNPGADLTADLAAIDGSFGTLAGDEVFDVALGLQLEFFLNLDLDPEALAIEAVLVAELVAGHGEEAEASAVVHSLRPE